MFGELIGLWAAHVWSTMDYPERLQLVELGPGRGTLMADALRACRVAPEFLAAIEVTMVETSPILRERQQEALADCGVPVSWAFGLDDVPEGPLIVIANEFFDALPVRHFVRAHDGWCEKLIGNGADGRFFAGMAANPEPLIRADAPLGSILEIGAVSHQYMNALAIKIAEFGGAALVIDYGHTQTCLGDTVQALWRHQPISPLEAPGECDVTAHVDFASLARAAEASGALVSGPVKQASFLTQIGLHHRADALKRRADPAQSLDIDRALADSPRPSPKLAPEASRFRAWAPCSRRWRSPAPTYRRRPALNRMGIRMMQDLTPALPAIRSALLESRGIAHSFFTRQGGVSEGVYASLNGGAGSADDPEVVAQNKSRMALALGVPAQNLLIPYQIHSAQAASVDAPWTQRPHCDSVVTATRGLALGVTGADCGIVLFCDPGAQVIAAAHAGWKGALEGVLDATLEQMERLGASRPAIRAVLGPTIAQASYEVGPEFVARFKAQEAGAARFFVSGASDRAFFDLPGFIGDRLARAGIGAFENLGLDTYSDEARFYSYRRSVHRREPDFGRLVAAIALP
jgi:YfiH family protein